MRAAGIFFLILAFLAALIAFRVLGAVAGAVIDIAQIAFWIFLILGAISLVSGYVAGRRIAD